MAWKLTGTHKKEREKISARGCVTSLCHLGGKFSALLITFNRHLYFYIILYVWVFYLHVCLCTTYMPCILRGQKRTLNPLKPELQTCGCWDSNVGPLEEQALLSIIQMSLQPWLVCVYLLCFFSSLFSWTEHCVSKQTPHCLAFSSFLCSPTISVTLCPEWRSVWVIFSDAESLVIFAVIHNYRMHSLPSPGQYLRPCPSFIVASVKTKQTRKPHTSKHFD